ncbi:MAG TPA: protein-disulfide reductase DsbD domain-containing protein [Vicinamibacterales bacterium]|nr:protein-disulfide reductase DsbD domain-containing protein [Vicinamibacterales bacterium]
MSVLSRSLVLTTVALLAVAAAQPAVPTAAPKAETKHLVVAASSGPPARGRIPLFLDVTPRPKMHVYAPDKRQTYIPVALSIAASDGLIVHAPKFPAPEKYFFEPLKETQLVYSRPFRIVQDVTLARAPADRRVTVKGTLRYQACDDRVCYMPQSVGVVWEIKVP